MDLTALTELVVGVATSSPKLAGFCTIAYGIGFGVKLLREAVSKFVSESESKEDDKKLEEIESSKGFKAFAMVMDLFFRLKIKK